MSSPSPDRNHRFIVLDGLRGVAAIMVMILHSSNYFAPMAGLAVDLFFLLSGFVLAYGFGDVLSQPGPDLSKARLRFAIGRLIRLYPLYAVGSGLALIPVIGMVILQVYFYTPGAVFWSLLAAPFFIPLNYDWTFPLDPPAWSLSFELIANVVFLFIGSRRLPAIILVVASALLLIWSHRMWDDPGIGDFWLSLLSSFPRVIFSFFLGVLMCRLWCSGRLPKFSVHPLLLLALLTALYWVHPHHERHYIGVMIFIIQPLIIWVGACSTAKGWTSRLMVWLGMISYGVYVLHVPILFCVEGIQRLADPALLNGVNAEMYLLPLSVYFVVPLSILAAHWLTLRYEIPLRRRLTGRLNQWLATEPDGPQPLAVSDTGR